MYFAHPGTKEQFEGIQLPKNVLRQEVVDKKGIVLEEEIAGPCLFIEMEGPQPTPNHYAIGTKGTNIGKWLLSSEFM